MWKNIVFVALVVGLTSCGGKKAAMDSSNENTKVVRSNSDNIKLGKNKVVSYKSLGNGVASISLHLFENNTFKFNFKSIPQPDTNEKPTVISEKGTYKIDGNWSVLNFKKPNFSLSAIFDKNYGDATQFKVLDDDTVKINTTKGVLPIWGVVCEKQ
ncbi:hypothetical protein [Aequorivita marina]|uniref:hypothetical protein n=1 Tax=Aequorivita marina TaxID=3073654 RepID=UPI0028748635|nr:hypothetical protein [Aequorivita sp. S2608]MDS1297940.1 hypothetical protein [Aequorivita sp. S2608]